MTEQALGFFEWFIINYGREFCLFLAAIVGILISNFLTVQFVNHRWRRDIKRHMPEIQRQELQERDNEIQKLSERVEQLRSDNEILTATVRASASFLGQAREVLSQPEIMRKRAKEQAYVDG